MLRRKKKKLNLKYQTWYTIRPFIKLLQLARKRILYKIEHAVRPLNTFRRNPREYAVFLDNNVFTELLRRGQDVGSSFLWPFLGVEKWAKNGDKFHFAVTPFLLFEYLWITIPQPAKVDFKSNGLEKGSLEDVIRAVYNYAYDFYRTEEVTKISHLRKVYEEQLDKQAPVMKPFFYQMIGNYMIDRLEPIIHSYLAWDFATKTVYPKTMHRGSHVWFVAEAISLMQQGLNVSCFRKFSEISIHVAREDDWHMSPEEKAEILAEVSLKDKSDYVDSELPVVAVAGWNLPDGPQVEAHCFTCDRPAEVESRIVSAKANINFGYWIHKKGRKEGKVKMSLKIFPKHGFVHCLEPKTLKAKESFNIKWII